MTRMQALNQSPCRRSGDALAALSLAALLLLAPSAQADFAAAMAAYQRGDHAAAAREARAPADAGDADAQLLLGDLYANGQGLPQDFVLAHLWYNLAAARGAGPAAASRDALARSMTPQQLAEAQTMARQWQPRAPVAKTPAPAPAAPRVDAAEVQRLLALAGYDPGPADGMPGQRTRTAVRDFQADSGMRVDGELTPELLAALRQRAPAGGGARLPATMVTATTTTLYAVPDSGAGSLGQLSAGSRVMTGDSSGSWVQVRALPPASGVGWVDSYSLQPDSSGAPVPGASTAAVDAVPQAQAEQSGGGFFSGLARGVSGLFGSGSASAPATGGTTATIGIRGFDTSQLAAGRPNAAEFAKLETYAVAPDAARSFALQAGLNSSRVAYLPDPNPRPAATSGGTVRNDKNNR